MRECLVIGRQGAGKTLLCLRLTELSGIRTPLIEQEWPMGNRSQRAWTLRDAHTALVGHATHKTIGMQTFGLGFSQAMSERFLLQDSTGLEDGIVEDLLIRMGMASTLRHFASAESVLHVIDSCLLDKTGKLPQLDEAIYSLAQSRRIPYSMVLNKMDLAPAFFPVKMVRKRYHLSSVFPISARTGNGVESLWQVLGKKNVVH